MERIAKVIEAVERERMVGRPSRPVKMERTVAVRAVRTANTGVHAIWRKNSRKLVIIVSFWVGGCTTPSRGAGDFFIMLL
jgi:hypothetical protein